MSKARSSLLTRPEVKNNPQASICTPQGGFDFKEIAIYQDYHGLPEFREVIANFMSRVRGSRVKFNPSRIVMSRGATGAYETVAFCLANPGEGFLVPIPYYPGFNSNDNEELHDELAKCWLLVMEKRMQRDEEKECALRFGREITGLKYLLDKVNY
nr:1-aminocyclopropane-1-carboxylate synthase-like [Tanacetum cinerariifolium]